MKSKRTIQIIITSIAILIGLLHALLPNLKIDAIFITLLVIAIIPWLEPLFKSVEFPGGLKVEFQELKKLEKDAKKAGLIKEKYNIKKLNPETFSFIETAERNQQLALIGFRIELEKRLRKIAEKYSIESNKYSIGNLIEALSKNEILTLDESHSLKEIIKTLNNATHGIGYDENTAKWVIKNGPKILDSLDQKLEGRGGRFSVGRSNQKKHWIDSSFENCNWITNFEWGECIEKHAELWNKELERIYKSLLKKLKEPQKEKLIESQSNWKKQLELDKDLIYSFENLRIKIGREGMLVTVTHFMNKIRERTLELEEILNRMAE